MIKTVSAYEARTNLGELMDLVHFKDREIIIERRGKPMVRLVKAVKKNPIGKRTLLNRYIGLWEKADTKKMRREAHKLRRDFKLF